MSKTIDPFRAHLRDAGEVNWETIPDNELSERVAYDVVDGTITADQFEQLLQKRGQWRGTAHSQEWLNEQVKGTTPERREMLRKAMAACPADLADDDDDDHQAKLAKMEAKLRKKFGFDDDDDSESLDAVHSRLTKNLGDGDALMRMALEDADQSSGGSRITYTKGNEMRDTQRVEDVFIRVKGSNESYRNTRQTLKHSKWDAPIHPIRNGVMSAEPVESLSEWENAKIGAFFKFQAAKSGFATLNEHDRAVLDEMFEKDQFIGWDGDREVRVKGVKALINDSTSGGDHLVPEYFDTRVISFPLLHSELLPYVDIVDVPRGAAVETVSIGNPTVIWNNTEGSAQNLFNTADLIAPITATIFPVAVYLEIGRDLMADSLPMIGSQLTANVGQRVAAELDRVIVAGSGTTEPQGVLNASGTNNVTPEVPTTGPASLADLLELLFAIGKQYRGVPAWNSRFAMHDQRYRSHRAIATGVTGDDRLLHGMSVQSYTLLEVPVSIENSGLTPAYGLFGAWKKYRLWRRAGFETRFETGGATLARANTALFCGRGRYGGKVVDGNAFAVLGAWPPTV